MTHADIVDLEPGTIFATGQDIKWGIWVAVRGGISDWTIYCDNNTKIGKNYLGDFNTIQNAIKECGNKVYKEAACRLIYADEELSNWYRA